jgi:hypothetical protein
MFFVWYKEDLAMKKKSEMASSFLFRLDRGEKVECERRYVISSSFEHLASYSTANFKCIVFYLITNAL